MTKKAHANKPTQDKLSDNLGIDVSKRQLDCSFGPQRHRASVPNAPEGFARISELCRLRPGLRVICEATGGYEKKLVKALRKEGIEVHVVMPLKVRCLAIAMSILSKTDQIDADKLLMFGEKIDLDKPHAPSEHEQKLRELVECRRHLGERLVQLAGRRENARPRLLELLDKEREQSQKHMEEIEKEIEACIAENKDSQDKIERMSRVKGVGRKVAANVLALIPELGGVSDKTASALAGVAPYPDQSGLVEKPRHIRGGCHEVRRMLFPSAMSAMQSNPVLKQFNQRLKDKGKPGMVRVVAVMRKLICLFNQICADPNFNP